MSLLHSEYRFSKELVQCVVEHYTRFYSPPVCDEPILPGSLFTPALRNAVRLYMRYCAWLCAQFFEGLPDFSFETCKGFIEAIQEDLLLEEYNTEVFFEEIVKIAYVAAVFYSCGVTKAPQFAVYAISAVIKKLKSWKRFSYYNWLLLHIYVHHTPIVELEKRYLWA